MKLSDKHPVILFDGYCNLCNASVRFILARDYRSRFRFATLQSETAKRILTHREGDNKSNETVVLWENGQIFTKSTAALRINRQLSFPWPVLTLLLIIPRLLRDAIYDYVSRHRYQWFGRRESCDLPLGNIAGRFLD